MSNFLKSLLWVSAASFIIALLNPWLWIGEIFVSFSLQHLISTLLLVVIYWVYKQKKYAIGAGVLLCVQLWYIYPASYPDNVQGSTKINILQYNVNWENKKLDKLVAWLEANHESFDIISLQEVTPELQQKLERLKDKFPYCANLPFKLRFTQVLFSKIPFTDKSIKFFPCNARDYLVVNFNAPNYKPFTFFAVHTTSPKTSYKWECRNAELCILSDLLNSKTTKYKLVVGDFNTTPYSNSFKNLIKSTGMKSAHTNLFFNTWPSQFKLNSLMVPIDHLLVSPNIKILKRKTGPNLGSDHLPVITTVWL